MRGVLLEIGVVEWFFLGYFVLTSGFYLLLNYLAVVKVFRHLEETALERFHVSYTGLEPPISLLVPAYNEERSIVTTVYSVLQLEYPELEVVVINDGSSDATLEVLRREFRLEVAPEVYRRQLSTAPVQRIYRSRSHRNLRVVDKLNGGKADALNAGINCARFPLFCSIDADSFLERQSLRRVVLPFIEDAETVAVGGTVRIANGCDVEEGTVSQVNLPSSLVALFQIVEYLRAFLFGRMGWAQMNSLLIVSGAFGLFKRSAVVDAGGYATDTIGEDMELVVRLHHHFCDREQPYKITFVPEPICWTEVPTELKVLKTQRARWQRGLSESLWRHRQLMFHRNGGWVGWVGMPFMLLVEWLSPAIEVVGYVYMLLGLLLGFVDYQVMAIFLSVSIGFGTLLSVMGLVLEEISFKVYSRPGQAVRLFAAAVLENFGFRQLVSLFRLLGILQWLAGTEHQWGEMNHQAPWESETDPAPTDPNSPVSTTAS